MNTEMMTFEEIRRRGHEVLARELGPVGLVRFLQQFETGHGNYAEERHALLEEIDVRTLAEKIRRESEARPGQ